MEGLGGWTALECVEEARQFLKLAKASIDRSLCTDLDTRVGALLAQMQARAAPPRSAACVASLVPSAARWCFKKGVGVFWNQFSHCKVAEVMGAGGRGARGGGAGGDGGGEAGGAPVIPPPRVDSLSLTCRVRPHRVYRL